MRMRSERANQVVLAALVLLILATLGYMPIYSAEPFKVPAETLIVCGAWPIIALIATITPRWRLGAAQRWLLCLVGRDTR